MSCRMRARRRGWAGRRLPLRHCFGDRVCPHPRDPPVVTPFFFTENETKSNAVIYGWSLSGGLDIMLMPCLFMRAEFEFVNFQPIWNISSSISTGRVGVGYKF